MFHYSFSAPLQAVTEIIENKDATILVSSAWQWAVGGRGREHRAAGPGRTHPLGPSPQLQPPCRASRAPSATARLPPWAAGLRGHGALQLLLIPSAQEAARPGDQHRPQPAGTGVGKAHPNAGLPHKGSCRGAAPGPRAARALAPPGRAGSPSWVRSPPRGCSPQCSQPGWAGSCCWRGREEGAQPGPSHPSVHHRQQRVRPEQPTHVQKRDAQPSCRSCHLMVQNQKTLPRQRRPWFSATSHSSSPYCSFYCN